MVSIREPRGAIAFLFPGQGSQRPGMAAGLASEPARAVLERARAVAGVDVDALDEKALARPEVQPAIVAVSIAACRALEALGVRPDVVAGHSLGEHAALVASGMLDPDDALRVVAVRARAVGEAARARPGGMLAVLGLPVAAVEAVAGVAGVAVAALNAPDQTVLAGDEPGLERAAALVRERGGRALRLRVPAAMHSPLVAAAGPALASALAACAWRPPTATLVSCVTGRPVADPAEVPDLLVRGLTEPVRWTEVVGTLLEMGVRAFVEVGPGTVLSGLLRRIAPETTVFAVGDDGATVRVAELLAPAGRGP